MATAKAIDVVVLNPADNVCVAARSLQAGSQIEAGGRKVTLAEAVRLGHKIAIAPIAAGAPVIKYGQTIGFADRGDRAGGLGTQPQLVGRPVYPRLRQGHRHSSQSDSAGRSDFPGLSTPRPPGRHAQLHRRHLDGQLLGHGQPLCRSPLRSRNPAARFSQRRWRRGLRARRRLRHALQGAESSSAQSGDGGNRPASEHRRLCADRLGLRNGHDRLAAGRAQPGPDQRPLGTDRARIGRRDGWPAAGVQHAGSRGHAKNDRRRRETGRRAAAPGQRCPPPAGSG